MLLPDLSPARALMRAACQHPRRPSLIHAESGRVWTVEESARRVRVLAKILADLGVSAGDRVAIVARNSPWHFVLHAACSWIHALTVPLSPRLPAEQLAQILRDCSPQLVLTDEAEFPLSLPILRLDDIEEECARQEASPSSASVTDLAVALSSSFVDLPSVPPHCHEEDAAIVYTSGSSGTPRGVLLTHAHLWWASASFRDGFEYSPGRDVIGVCAPLSHIGGFNGTSMDTFSHGGSVVVFSAFSAQGVLRAIEKYRITQMFAVPTMCHLLLEAQKTTGADLSSWTRPLIGGDSMGIALREQMTSAGLPPIHVWGMTETGGAGTMLSHDAWDGHPGTIGFPFPYVDLRLIDEAGAEISAPGVVGEIQVCGPGISTRYYRSAATDAEDASRVPQDSWLRTGDLACYTPSGAVQMMGRASRVINTGGELVAPALVEDALRAVGDIADALVVGVDSERWGQVVGALVRRVPSPIPAPSNAAAHSQRNTSFHEEISPSAAGDSSPNTALSASHTAEQAFSSGSSDVESHCSPTPPISPATASRRPGLPRVFSEEERASLRQILETQLAPWQLPRHLVWVEALPMTTTGKPDIETARRILIRELSAENELS